jgi:hypothetical protein
MITFTPCKSFAPDTFALDYYDGIDGSLFCSTCGCHQTDHLTNEGN